MVSSFLKFSLDILHKILSTSFSDPTDINFIASNKPTQPAAITKESLYAQQNFVTNNQTYFYQEWFVCYFTLFVYQESGTGQTAASGYLMLTPAAVSSQEQPFSFKNFKSTFHSVGFHFRKK
jgi:hypothetical protein